MSIYVIPSEIEAEAMQATPHAELIAQVMNPCVPKTEREWAAQREIERQQARCAQLEDALLHESISPCPECERLHTRCAELEKDAARYRWLRGDSCPDHSPRWTQWEVRCWKSPRWSDDLRRAELDAAIDAARREK